MVFGIQVVIRIGRLSYKVCRVGDLHEELFEYWVYEDFAYVKLWM